MRVITTIQEMVTERYNCPRSRTVGFVPTMGYLHEGHLSLVHQARAENDILTASIFVNPIQFGPHEDLDSYPRDLPRDLNVLENLGVDMVFVPTPDMMYPSDFVTYVDPTGPLAHEAEGAFRPEHFRGVATIVLKLFQIMQPHHAYFGQKDAQQAAVITHLISDFNLLVKLHILPTIREADGLAMSSRNAYLDQQERAAATVLYRALQAGRSRFIAHPLAETTQATRAMIQTVESEPRVHLDYTEIRDPVSFAPLEVLRAPALLLIAARVGSTRLIDNFLLRMDGTWDTGILISA